MLSKIKTYASFVRFSHSVFALPFAFVGALLAARGSSLTLGRVMWIVGAMVTARSAAMGFNRLVDARFDAQNPRTAMRELPRGALSQGEALSFVVVASALFVGCAWALGPVCFALAPIALAVVFWYSLAKRYTWATQLYLGFSAWPWPWPRWAGGLRRAEAPAGNHCGSPLPSARGWVDSTCCTPARTSRRTRRSACNRSP
jgi:4-hydroxybenzoate polyprenyltransferase